MDNVVQQGSWAALVQGLTAWLQQLDHPFRTATVVVDSGDVGKVLSQQVAAASAHGISAGVHFLSLAAWQQGLARAADLTNLWDSRALEACLAAQLQAAPDGSLLWRYLRANPAGSRRWYLAEQTAAQWRRHARLAPHMVRAWLEGRDVDGHGQPLPAVHAWQPPLLRQVSDALGQDPLQHLDELTAWVQGPADHPQTGFFALSDVAPSQTPLLSAFASSHPCGLWSLEGAHTGDWTSASGLTGEQLEPVASRPAIQVHGASTRLRQAQVLGDEVLRLLQADPELEPRDVVVICPSPQEWAPHLMTAFLPALDPQTSPARQLRLQVPEAARHNLLTHLVLTALQLNQVRATAQELTDLFLLPPVARRFGLAGRRDEITPLLDAAGVRWGLDSTHRAEHGLEGLTQNTWLRGTDRLLAGLALPPVAHDIPVTGVAVVESTHLSLIGALTELVSRLRRFNAEASGPATADQWRTRVQRLLDELVLTTYEDDWMLLAVHEALAQAADQMPAAEQLTRSEFRLLLAGLLERMPHRPSAGNGGLHVVAPGQLQHVAHQVVCLLGVDDSVRGDEPIALGADVPSRRQRLVQQILDHARQARHLLVVEQSQDAATAEPVARATTLTQVLRALDHAETEAHPHALVSHSPREFLPPAPGHTPAAFATAAALAAGPTRDDPRRTRLHQAVTRRVDVRHHQADTALLARFLKDPAAHFVRSTSGIRQIQPTALSDDIPLSLSGLDTWAVRNRLLTAFQRGLPRAEAEAEEQRRELLPPGALGRDALAEAAGSAARLWQHAEQWWTRPVEDHVVGLELQHLSLHQTIRTRGDAIVHVTASRGQEHRFETWLTAVVLAAHGHPVTAHVFQPQRGDFGQEEVVHHWLNPPSPERALEYLSWLARAFAEGSARLWPVPQELGTAHVRQLLHPRKPPEAWTMPRGLWSWFLHEPTDVLHLPADPTAPEPDDPFRSWAARIYWPLLAAGDCDVL